MPLLGTYIPPATEAERQLERRLKAHVEVLAGQIGPRYPGRPAALEAAAAYVERQLADLGDQVKREVYRAAGAKVANIVVERPGCGQADEVVLLGAHYDTLPGTPGADDNASAVAALIEAARLLRPVQTRRTVRFVAFPCEEPPYFSLHAMGSQHHAGLCRQRNERIVGMVSLEMVGYYSTAPGSQEAPPQILWPLRLAFPRRGDFLVSVGNLRSLALLWSFRRGFRRAGSFPLYSVALPEWVQAIRLSDNSSFWDQGYPALMVTDTSFLRNPHYHQPSDTPETLDYGRLAMVTLGIAGGVAWTAGASGQVSAGM